MINQQLSISAFLARTMFFLIGILKSFAPEKPAFLSGVRTFLTGAAALAYFTAYFYKRCLTLLRVNLTYSTPPNKRTNSDPEKLGR
ncbi:MAG: hypothetical protein ACI9Z9_002151 [Litorivivens sp.]|jgi:hypothetical protein